MTSKKNIQKQPKKTKTAHDLDVAQPTAPDWPQLRPLIPTSDLSLTELVEGQIAVIHNLFTATLCRSFVSFLSTLPLATTPGKPEKGHALRVNDRFQIDDPVFAERLWSSTALKELVLGYSSSHQQGGGTEDGGRQLWDGDVVGLNPNIRIYRYRKGQFFDRHYDDSNLVVLPTDPPTPAQTTWTLLIYLTSPATGCIGGETVFYPDDCQTGTGSKTLPKQKVPKGPVIVGLETGMALLHRHGDECMLHEGREVLAGEKWVIRSDLCVKRSATKKCISDS